MQFVGLADVFEVSSQHSHYFLQSGPQLDSQVATTLLLGVHPVLQDDNADNMKDPLPLIFSVSSLAFLTHHYHAHKG